MRTANRSIKSNYFAIAIGFNYLEAMDARSLECFSEIAARGSFRLAAKTLGLSQPALTARVQRLEDELGFALFERSVRGALLTERGRLFLPYARQSVDALARTRAAVAPIRDGGEGRLRVGYTPIAALSYAPPLVQAFRAAHPRVLLDLKEMTSEPIEAALAEGALDAGILHPPVRAEGLSLQRLRSAGLLVVMPRSDPLATRASADLGELADRAFVLVARRIGPYVFDRIISDCLAAGFHPRIVQEVETSVSVLGMVAAGMGLGLVVAPLAQFKHPDLAFVEPTGLSYRLEFSLAWRNGSGNPQVEALRSAASACFD